VTTVPLVPTPERAAFHWTRRILYGPAIVAVVTALLLLVRADLAIATSVSSLAVVCAAVFGYPSGFSAAITAFLTINFFFTEPLHSFTIARNDDLVSLLVSVATATIIGAGVARLNRLRVRASVGEREALLRLTFFNELVDGHEPSIALERAAEELVVLFDLAACTIRSDHAVYTATSDKPAIGRRRIGDSEGALGLDLELSRALDEHELRTLEALAASFGSALQRIRLDAQARESQLQGQLDRSRASFLTAVTHDLRTPLATIKAGTGALLARGTKLDDADRRRMIQVAHDESARLERLIAKVLELTRIRAGGLRPEPLDISAADMVRVAVRRLDTLVNNREILLDIDPGLPALWVDPAMLEHALVNLIENALRYSPAGTPIEIRAESKGNTLELRVIDHGDGVPPEERERIFEEFVRLDPRAESSGTGLGLAIVRAFVEAADGTVACEMTPGGGASFVLTLPTVEEPAGEEVR
jgi:two-component system sensor histidine kinase KdpD